MTNDPGEEFGGLLGAMSELQQRLQQAEQQANARVVEGSSAQGLVRIEASGEFSFDRVRIDPSVVDRNDVELLEDLVLAALRDAAAKLKGVRTQAMGGAVSEMLGNLFGGVQPPMANEPGRHEPGRHEPGRHEPGRAVEGPKD